MGNVRKILLAGFLVGVAAVILLTWGSVGSAILTIALLTALGFLALRHFFDTRSPDDYRMEE